jgi:rubrerythrin
MEAEKMSFNQTRDILEHARSFHRRLIRFYLDLKHMTDDAMTLNVLEELIGHEIQLELRLAEYEDGASGNTLDTFFKYMAATTDQEFSSYPLPDTIDIDYVISAARYFDDKLTRFYESMAKKAISVQVRDVLENLRQLEQREQLALSKMMLSLQDT